MISINPIVYYKNIAQFERRHLSDTLKVDLVHTPPQDLVDSISIAWNKLGGPISFIYGVLVGISPWLIKKIREFIMKRKHSK